MSGRARRDTPIAILSPDPDSGPSTQISRGARRTRTPVNTPNHHQERSCRTDDQPLSDLLRNVDDDASGPVSASRPCGRCAVGLRPSLDPNPHPDGPNPPPKKIKNNGPRGVDISGATDKQGSRLVRWAAVEAVQRVPAHTRLGQRRDRVGEH